MGISGFRVPMFSGFGLTGGGLWAAGLKWVGSVVLFPPRAILPQGEESDGSLRRCRALPGRGRCRCARSMLFALRAKALREWRAVFRCIAEKTGFRRVLPIRKLPPARRGNGGTGLLPARVGVFPARRQLHVLPMSLSPQETGRYAPSHRRNEPLTPAKPSTLSISANAALYKPRLIAPAFCGEHRARAQAQLSAPAKGYLSPFPPPHPPSSRLLRRRRRTAPARGLSAVYALCRRKRNETKRPCPLLVGHGRVNTEPTALAGDTVALPASTCRRPCRLRRGRQPVPARGCP